MKNIQPNQGHVFAPRTCPAEMLFCKHAVALGRTWLEEPDSFFDLTTLEVTLQQCSKAELLSLIQQIAESHPAALSVLGVEGFEEEEEWSEEW